MKPFQTFIAILLAQVIAPFCKAAPVSMPEAIIVSHRDSIVLENNAQGTWWKNYTIHYNRIPKGGMIFSKSVPWFQELEEAYISLLGPDGKRIAKYGRKELLMGNGLSSFSLYEDNWQYYLVDPTLVGPVDLQVILKIKLKGLIALPQWFPYIDPEWPVQQASFVLQSPAAMKIQQKLDSGVKLHSAAVPGNLRFELDNLPALDLGDMELAPDGFAAKASFTLEEFSIEGLAGKLDSWKELGAWQGRLMQGLDKMPPALVEAAKVFQSKYPDPRQRAAAIYKAMQDSKRYVSIQKGLGGWRPFSVEEVEGKGYGDCKALSYYMVSMLRATGIKAYCALILAGEDAFADPQDFPSLNFNHMIVCIPFQDTVWLECTSNKLPFGFMGGFTEARKALLVTEQGGVLVSTHHSTADQNTRQRTLHLKIGEDRLLTGLEKVRLDGARIEEIQEFTDMAQDDRDAWMGEAFTKRGLASSGFALVESSREPPFIATYGAMVASIKPLQLASTRILFPLGSLLSIDLPEASESSRTMPFLLSSPGTDIDSVWIELPVGTTQVHFPDPIKLETKFGAFSQEFSHVGQQMLIVQAWATTRGVWEAAEWPAYRAFLQATRSASKRMVIVEK